MSERFKAFFARALPDVRHFTAEEFLVRGSSDARLKLNTDPPEELWPNIVPTVRVLEALRTRLGKPIILHSVYRSPAYNRAIGGATGSMHMQFRAVDFHIVDANSGPADWAATLRSMRSAGVFRGGIGAYATFVHVDTRSTNADFDQIDASKGRVLPAVVRPTPAPRPPVIDAEPIPDLSRNAGCNLAGLLSRIFGGK